MGCYCETVKMTGCCPVCNKNFETQGVVDGKYKVVQFSGPGAQQRTQQQAQAKTPEQLRVEVLRKLWLAAENKQVNVALGLAIGLVGGDFRDDRIKALVRLDEAAGKRGYMTQDELVIRIRIHRAVWRDLGWNPLSTAAITRAAAAGQEASEKAAARRYSREEIDAVARADARYASRRGPSAPQQPAETPKAMGEGFAAPLVMGDWKGLWERVEAGLITDAEARGFAHVWREQQRKA